METFSKFTAADNQIHKAVSNGKLSPTTMIMSRLENHIRKHHSDKSFKDIHHQSKLSMVKDGNEHIKSFLEKSIQLPELENKISDTIKKHLKFK